MARIIHDNIPELMAADGRQVTARPATDSQEFFALLQRKMVDDINGISKETTVAGKAKRIVDVHLALQEFIGPIGGALQNEGSSYPKFMSDRQTKVGSFSKRLIVDTVDHGPVGDEERELLKYGAANDWPELHIAVNQDLKPYLSVPAGEENWRHAMTDLDNLPKMMDAMNHAKELRDRD